jgi:poly(3-hydroxybutyrate) depolymerase
MLQPDGVIDLIYQAYEAIRRSTRPAFGLLEAGHKLARHPRNPLRNTYTMRAMATACELPARALKDYKKPEYVVWEALGDMDIVLPERKVASLPFANLLNFPVEDGAKRPKLLIVAALSGHHATLLQDTIRGFARDFDTYITDWRDARDVPLSEGKFGFDDYVRHVMEFIEILGPDTHVVATCQAAPPAMVAAAMLARDKPEFKPATLTLMGGPVDTRVNPGALGKITEYMPLGLMRKTNIHKIPRGYPGSGRRVYPGFIQLSGFISLNPKPHVRQYTNFVKNGVKGNDEPLEKFRDFYDEYFAVVDMTEEFYIETLQKVFFEHHIPNGMMTFEGEPVDFASVTGMGLLTVEGGNDHFCPPGQTEAAQPVFAGLADSDRHHHVQEGVGHYGVFSGSKFQAEIYPVIRDFIKARLPVEASDSVEAA